MDFYLGKRIPVWRKIVEWAPEPVQTQEPRTLPWRIQIVAIVGIVILLAIFLLIITSELRSAPAMPSNFLPLIHRMASLVYIPI